MTASARSKSSSGPGAGIDADVEHYAPTAADETFGQQLATYFRRSASPGVAAALHQLKGICEWRLYAVTNQ